MQFLLKMFFALSIVAIPAFMASYLYMLRLVFDAQPNWIFILIGISHFVTWIAFALLYDFRQESRNQPPYYRQKPPADLSSADQP